MSRAINAMNRGELQRGLRAATKDLERMTRDISGADSEPVKRAADVLRTQWRALVSVKNPEPAPPGSPPHRHRGRLWKSIKTAVVDGVRRVGSGDFRSWMTEFGTDGRAPRPHARTALELAQPQMTEVLVQESQRLAATAPLGGGA